uniref:O-methyltransferase n=1 Tax=Candidatus Kentrum sp. SD TaxID=2126332 RepID=A0A450YIT2_9GAMM|nr:MAG: O-methyltransferase [Candidatus Kentron sp. SD]VFK47208.1 MAG: O-methyltransferase [Candidatus Kentron sp. SD]
MVAILALGKSMYQLGRERLFYDYLRVRENLAAFDRGMESMSQVEVEDVLRDFDFSGAEHLTEIAGGNGALISGALRKHENMAGQLVRPAGCRESGRAHITPEGFRREYFVYFPLGFTNGVSRRHRWLSLKRCDQSPTGRERLV